MTRAGHNFRNGGPAAASLLVTGLLIAALFNLGMGHVSRRAESPALTVLSLAPLKGSEEGREEAEAAAPAPPSPTAPSPSVDPAPTPDRPLPPPPLPPTLTQPAVSIPSRVALPMPVQPTLLTTSPSAAPPTATTSPSTLSASPATPVTRKGGADGLDAKAPPGASRSYAAKVRSWLYAHKIYPRRARMRREEGRVQVRFILDRAGMLLEGAVVQGSGNATLDEEARAMMRRASPYPSAPAELPGDRIEFIAPIEFILPV